MQQVIESIQAATGLSPALQARLVETLVVVLLLTLARGIIVRLVWRRTQDARIRYRSQKGATYAAALVGFLLVGRIWFQAFGPLATFLGLLSAGLAVALKDVVADVAGWVFIVWRRPFAVGDRVQVGPHAGDVIDQRLFQFTLLEIGNWVDADQSTGRIIHVPNGKIFTEPLANYTQGLHYIWNEIPVPITFESDWRKAKQILTEIANRHGKELSGDAEQRVLEASRRYMIFYSTLTPTVYTAIAPNGVVLTIRYLCDPRRRRGTAQAVWEDILTEFQKHDDIGFAYPTQRFFDNVLEGKPGARAVPADAAHRPGG